MTAAIYLAVVLERIEHRLADIEARLAAIEGVVRPLTSTTGPRRPSMIPSSIRRRACERRQAAAKRGNGPGGAP